MERTPLVSIGIPTYNRASRLPNAIKSILQQDYTNLEIVISDNCSPDNTEEVCRALAAEDSRIRYFRQPENQGIYPNFQFVRDQALGKYFMWVSDDDELSAEVLSTYVKFMEAHPDYVTVIGRIDYWEGKVLKDWEEGFSFEDDSPTRRVSQFYAKVVRGALWHGLHRRDKISAIPIENSMATDWHVIAAIAFMGKIKNLQFTGYNKRFGGVSSNYKKIVKAFNLSPIWAYFPFYKIALETYGNIMHKFPQYQKLGSWKRFRLALRSSFQVWFHYYGHHYPKMLGGKILRGLNITTPSAKKVRKANESSQVLSQRV